MAAPALDPAAPGGAVRLVGLAGLFAAFGALAGVWASRLPTLKAKLDIGSAELGLALFFTAVGACLGAWLFGRVERRLGLRGVGRAAAAGLAFLLVGISLAPTLEALCGVMLALGLLLALLDIALNADAVRAEGEHGRAVLSRLHAGFSLGLALGAGTGAAAEAAQLSLPAHFGLAAAVLTLVFVLASRVLSLRMELRSAQAAPARWTAPLLVITGLAFCAMLAEGVAADWTALLVAEDRGAGRALGAAALATFGAAMFGARLVGDWIVDRLGRMETVWAGAALAVAGLGLAAGVPHVGAAFVGLFVAGVGVAPLFPNLTGLAAEQNPERPEAGVARIAATSYVAFLIGPAASGWGAEHVGLPSVFGMIAGLLALAGVIAALLLRRKAPVASAPARRLHERP